MGQFAPKNYWEDRLKQQAGLVGVGYARLGRNFNHWMYRVRRRIFLQEAAALYDWKAASVLDVGSGTGFYIDCWETLGAGQIAGVDLTKVAVEGLQSRFPKHAFHELNIGAVDAVKALPGNYDAISMMDVLYHIIDDADYEQAIRNLYGLLKPGGFFIFCDFLLHDENPAQPQAHVRRRSLAHVERVLQSAGFEIQKRKPLFVLMNQPVDSHNPLLVFYWKAISFLISKSELVGQLFGAALYPLENVLVKNLGEGPSTEIVICKRPE